jgi:hypothetical protein
MTGAGLLEIERGAVLGSINYHGVNGDVPYSAGKLREGVIPEQSILASDHTQAYIAEALAGYGDQEVVIAVHEDDESAETIVGIEARDSHSHEPLDKIDSVLLIGGVKVALREAGVETVRIDPEATNVLSALEEHATEVGLIEGSSGELVLRV